MKSRLSPIFVTTGWLLTNLAWAVSPFPVPPQGGLPECQESLSICDTNLTLCNAALAACDTNAQRLSVSGQKTCWYWAAGIHQEIPCAGTGQDGEFQAGAPLSYTDNGDGTITDNNTKLMLTTPN